MSENVYNAMYMAMSFLMEMSRESQKWQLDEVKYKNQQIKDLLQNLTALGAKLEEKNKEFVAMLERKNGEIAQLREQLSTLNQMGSEARTGATALLDQMRRIEDKVAALEAKVNVSN